MTRTTYINSNNNSKKLVNAGEAYGYNQLGRIGVQKEKREGDSFAGYRCFKCREMFEFHLYSDFSSSMLSINRNNADTTSADVKSAEFQNTGRNRE